MVNVLRRDVVRANRMKWIEFLKRPETLKGKNLLDAGYGHRCCLGHACVALGIEMSTDNDGTIVYGISRQRLYAPTELVNAVGLWNHIGMSRIGKMLEIDLGSGASWIVEDSLANLNDATEATPRQIGEYLESVIDGGSSTPFRPLTDYPEEALTSS